MNVSGHAILLVEDNVIIGLDIEDALERAGCTVVGPHPWLSSAFNAVGTVHVDAALLDVTIADGVVYPLADFLDRLNVPFVFVTGYEADSIPERFRNRPVLTKPFLHHELVEALMLILPSSSLAA